MKRILTSFLAIILATANPIYLNTASAAAVDSSYALDNHFSSDPTSMEFSAILDVKIEGSNAEVTFETTKNAVLSVILYDDEGTTVYACGSAEVSAGEKKAIVPIHADNGMPDHFFLRTALLDRETMRPLCSIYESPAWTQGITQIQEPALPAELISCPLNTSGMSGSLELKITPTITSYRSSLYRYTQIRLDYHAAITEFETSAAAEGAFPLSDIPSLPEGASLSFTAACDTAARLNGSLSGTIGYYILNDSGIHSLTSVPRLRTSPALDGCAVFGLSMNVSNITAQNTMLEMQAAVSGKASGHLSADASSISEHHDCTSCLEGTIVSKAELNFQAEQSDTGERYTLQQSQQCQSGNFYLSSNGGASDSQSCPQHTYQVTFTVLDSSGNKVEHAAIQADNAMPAVSLNTDNSGRASCYLPSGNYPITVSFPDGTTKYSKTVIQDQPKSIVIRAENPSYETIAPDEIHTAPKFKSVTFGDGHGGAVSQNGDLYTWGLNRYGSTGIGRISYTVDEIITPVKVLEHVAFADFGGESSAAVTENGDLYTWGWNRFGQLGYETEPVHTNDSYSTRPQKVELPGKVKALSMGSTNCAAILENGDLYTWGSNAQGKLGRGGSYSEYNPLPEKVNLPDKAVNVKMGGYESSAILENGDLYTWGDYPGRDDSSASYHYPGKVTIQGSCKIIAAGYMHSGAITEDGLYVWGASYGDAIPFPEKVTFISPPGYERTPISVLMNPSSMDSYVLTKEGYFYEMSIQNQGSINIDLHRINAPDNILSADTGYSCLGAVTQDGSLYTWGENLFGVLGTGTEISCSEPQQLFPGGNTAVFHNLTPGKTYYCYIVKDDTDSNIPDPSNLLYLVQEAADSSGSLSVSYELLQGCENSSVFLISADKTDISAAQITVSDLEYNGQLQYIQPTVTYHGQVLTEGVDYELWKDYSAKDVGHYTVTIHGIGRYYGVQDAFYQMTERIKLVENITLSLSDASTEAGSSIQLEAVVFPSDAANPSLKWISENPDIAVVDQNGLVTGIAEGKARIVVQSQDGSNIFAGCIVTVTLKPSAETNPDDVQKPSANNPSSGSSYPSGGSSASGSNPSSGGSYPSGGSSVSGSNPSGNTEVKLLYYIVSFNPNGGNRQSRKEMTLLMDERLGILPHVQMKGHLFSGWYTQKTNGRKVDENTAFHASTTLYAQWDTVTKPDKIKNLSLSDQGDGLVTITIASADDAQGYEIAYSTNKKFLKAQTNQKLVSAKSTNGKSVIKLKKGSAYYIRARAFRKDSAGNNIYGAYSDTKKIKPKN